MNRGYIKLWRKILDNPTLKEPGNPLSRLDAWIYLCLKARGTDEGMLKRGEFEASERFLSKSWLWSKSKVHRFLSELQGSSMIMRVDHKVDQQTDHKTDHFIICKYDLYNDARTTSRTTSRTTKWTKYNKVLNTVSNEGIKDTASPCTEKPADPRLKPLKIFIESEYLRIRGVKLLSDRSDWINFDKLLKDTNGTFSLDDLEHGWTAFLQSPSPFHRNQGHPLRWWSCNLNAFVGRKECKAGLYDGMKFGDEEDDAPEP